MHIRDLKSVCTQNETLLDDIAVNKKIDTNDISILYTINFDVLVTLAYKKFVKYIADTKYVYISCDSYVVICEKINKYLKCVLMFEKINLQKFDLSEEKTYISSDVVLTFKVNTLVKNHTSKQPYVFENNEIYCVQLKDAMCHNIVNSKLGITFENNNKLSYDTNEEDMYSMSIPGAIAEKIFFNGSDMVLTEHYGNNGKVIYRKVYGKFFSISNVKQKTCSSFNEMLYHESDEHYYDDCDNFSENFEDSPVRDQIDIDFSTVTECGNNTSYVQIFYIDPEGYSMKLKTLFSKYTDNGTDCYFCRCISGGQECIAVCKYVYGKELLCIHILKTYFPSLDNEVKSAWFIYNDTKVILNVGKYTRYFCNGNKYLLCDDDCFQLADVFFHHIDSAFMFRKKMIDDKVEVKINSVDDVLAVEPYACMKEIILNDKVIYCDIP